MIHWIWGAAISVVSHTTLNIFATNSFAVGTINCSILDLSNWVLGSAVVTYAEPLTLKFVPFLSGFTILMAVVCPSLSSPGLSGIILTALRWDHPDSSTIILAALRWDYPDSSTINSEHQQ
jgi:hypothetical protein